MPRKDVQVLQDEFGDIVPKVMYKGKGCRNCQGTGYRGRQGAFEMMPITDEIRALILERTSSRIIRKVAVEQGMSSLRQDGWRLIGEGKTTADEVLRMTKDEDVAAGQADQKMLRPQAHTAKADRRRKCPPQAATS